MRHRGRTRRACWSTRSRTAPLPDDLLPPDRIQFDNARDPYSARNALGILDLGGGGGGGAPVDAEYIVAVDDPALTNDRALVNTATVTWDFATPGQAKANASVALTGSAHGFAAHKSASQSIASATWTKLTFAATA